MIEETRVKEFLMVVRTALLMIVDAIEKWVCVSPTTAQIRREYKESTDCSKIVYN